MASMRPRLISRGNHFGGELHSSSIEASMRPRLISRGNGDSAGTAPAWLTSFNEATTDQSWKLSAPLMTRHIQGRFNEATTDQSWKSNLRRVLCCESASFNEATTDQSWKS